MQSSQDGLGLLLPGLVLFLAISGVVLFRSGPLQTDRPPNPNLEDQPFSDQRVSARLWQDPFEAVERELKDRGSAPDPWTPPATAGPCGVGEVHLIAALVDAGPYAESAEGRLRARYAILSGLDVGGYLPVDSTHIGYFSTAGGDLPERVPFERLARKDATGRSEQLVLLWLNSNAFNTEPIRRMQGLADSIPEWVAPRRCLCRTVKVLGPADSDGLAALIAEVRSRANGTQDALAPSPWRLHYYSATATATEPSLLFNAFGTSRAEMHGDCASVDDCIGLAVGFQRLIPDDGELAAQLSKELRLRGFCGRKPGWLFRQLRTANDWLDDAFHGLIVPGGAGEQGNEPFEQWAEYHSRSPSKHVVLISEWDSLYGRSLPVAVANALIEAKYGDPDALETVADFRGYPWLHYFSYMRGLDGNIPAGKGQGDGKTSESPASGRAGSAPPPSPASERAEGQAQLDYLRRLAAQIESLQNPDKSPARVFAIGILGSDLHDKTLILQALRPYFPAAAFFTTDLDARLRYAPDSPWTRGLIVASGYGLSPAEYDPDAWIPPFRVNYQTAMYLAVRQAFPGAHPLSSATGYEGGAQTAEPARVRLYEIGRNGPVELQSGESAPPSPAKEALRPWRARVLAGVFFAATLVCVLLLYHGTIRRFVLGHPLVFLASLALALVAIGSLLVILNRLGLDCPSPYNPVCLEPFSLLSGISAWMPVYLLVLATGLSIFFIPVLFLARRRVVRQIGRFYMSVPAAGAPAEPRVPPGLRDGLAGDFRWLVRQLRLQSLLSSIRAGRRRIREAIYRRLTHNPHPAGSGCPDNAERVWARHCKRACFGWRSLLPLLLALLFFYFVINLFSAIGGGGGGSAALRDRELGDLYINLRILSTLALSLLAFLYLDIAGCARQLIAELDRAGLRWSDPVREHYAREKLHVDSTLVDRWIALRAVARYTDMGVRIVVYPLLVLLLLAVARMPWFDTTSLPIGILVAYVVLAFYLLSSAWLLQRDARRMRDGTLTHYRRQLAELERLTPWAFSDRQQLRHLIGQVETMHDFAFQRFSENPLVRVAILPFGTLGLGLLELLG